MSLKVVHLDTRHSADLYKILVKNKDVGGLHLIQKKDIFLNPPFGGAIACVENDDTIKQVLLCEFKDNVCFTRGLFGDFGPHTLDVLDILCATCSSRTPIAFEHRIVVQPNHIVKFKEIWDSSRLGKMTTNESLVGIVFRATINYPRGI
jgi:hypothetical protein